MVDRVAPLLLALAALFGASSTRAQESASQGQFELSRSVQQSLARVQEGWLQWVGASLQDNDERADEALRSLSVAVREVGFQYLPDLGVAASAQARQSTRQRQWRRGERQLAAAEALDPGNPEIAFARARHEWARGNRWQAVRVQASGIWSTITGRAAAKARVSLLLWLLTVLMLSLGLFVALLAGRHGRSALAALRSMLSPPLPEWAAVGVVAFLVIAPLALPSGLFWFAWVISILMWTFASRSERAVIALGWALLALAPVIADSGRRALALDQTPPMRAWQAFESGRLYGGFFSDAQVLRTALPDDPAALEFAADVHRTLGQWDVARSLYRRVLLAEPQNVSVLLNLGAHAFRKGDYTLANAYFKRATETSTPTAAAWFNLSLGFSDAYLFDESREALGQARQIDGSAVDRWMATPNPDRVLTFNGSLVRRDEVRRALMAAWTQPEEKRFAGLPAGVVGAVLVGIGLLLAFAFNAAREGQVAMRAEPGSRREPGPLRYWSEALLPAVDAARRGDGVTAWANVALLSALALLPAAFEMAGDLPVPSWPGPMLLGVVAAVGGSTYLGVCVHTALHERDA